MHKLHLCRSAEQHMHQSCCSTHVLVDDLYRLAQLIIVCKAVANVNSKHTIDFVTLVGNAK